MADALELSEETDPKAAIWPRAGHGHLPALAMAGVAVALLAFYAYSQTVSIPFGIFQHPPLYGIWEPVLNQEALWVLPAAVGLAAVAWVVTSGRTPSWLALVLIISCAVGTAAAIAVVRGDWHDLFNGVSTAQEDDLYAADLHFVYEFGVRGFIERHSELIPLFNTWNSKTHPAGALVFLYILFETIGASHPLRITTALAALAMSASVAAWLGGRVLGGERAGRIAAVLFVAAPGPLLLSYTSHDAIFAALLSMSVALFMVAIHKSSPVFAATAGAVLAVATLMTYATAFILIAAAIAAGLQSSSIRSTLKLLGAAAGSGLVILVLAWLLLGFDLLGSYNAAPRSRTPYDPYWIIAHPAAVLIWAGLPLATFGVAGLFLRVRHTHRPILPAVLVVTMLIWGALPAAITGLRYGEVERTWAYLYPVLAMVAGPLVDQWTSGRRRRYSAAVAVLVLLSVGQAALIQALWDNLL